MKKNIIVRVLILISSPLTSMGMDTIKIIEDDEEATAQLTMNTDRSSVAPQWKYQCCPNAYSRECCLDRAPFLGCGGISFGFGSLLKGIDYTGSAYCCNWSYDRTVAETCSNIWGGSGCEDANDCCCTTLRISDNVLMYLGLSVFLCSAAPCLSGNKNECCVCIKKVPR